MADDEQRDEFYSGNSSSNYQQQQPQQQQPPDYDSVINEPNAHQHDDIVQVVYQSNQSGNLIGVESTLIPSNGYQPPDYLQQPQNFIDDSASASPVDPNSNSNSTSSLTNTGLPSTSSFQVQPLRSTSTLPSVAEESSGSGGAGAGAFNADLGGATCESLELGNNNVSNNLIDDQANTSRCSSNDVFAESTSNYNLGAEEVPQQQASNLQHYYSSNSIYTTINKHNRAKVLGQQQEQSAANYEVDSSQQSEETQAAFYSANLHYSGQLSDASFGGDTSSVTLQTIKHSPIKELQEENLLDEEEKENLKEHGRELNLDDPEDFSKFLSRSKGGAAESGSFRQHNFNRKKQLGLSVSATNNENDLILHRQKLKLEQQQYQQTGPEDQEDLAENEAIGSLPNKFKRNHSVSFNVGSGNRSRHSVDIKNLPSYLTVKRASIVDVAKGAMSSLMHSFGAGSKDGGSSISGSRRDSASPLGEKDDDIEPIFEEPIAPTLSLGQRVALVKNSGAEFGTVGWIGQLPEVDDDWIVGVIFDNMIGNCDGEHNGVRYFYSRENYAMFVPLSQLTKTDNYIGRPETGTMLSRMSVSLKPGQLISIHRSSIRLQHCFLNAPHQRVGHDVRAVSNRLHCQCHNCGPCAHLTKQGRLPHSLAGTATHAQLFGTHHVPNKKNSLAHAAVELLAHHHHHYHDEEEHEEEDYQFGDNAAHACNFVRYSCCQQTGSAGHDFSADCEMVRPDILDNLIHAPRAPIRKSRLRRKQRPQQPNLTDSSGLPQLEGPQDGTLESQQTITSYQSTTKDEHDSGSSSPCSKCSRSSSPVVQQRKQQLTTTIDAPIDQHHYNSSTINFYQTNVSSFGNTLNNQLSILDQQRFIYRKESSAFRDNDEDYEPSRSFGSSIRRCLLCLVGRKKSKSSDSRRKKPKKRKLSARNKMIEYRRRQSTFVPSTLAKPQEDFASHGIILPSASGTANINDSDSDYDNYKRSPSSSSSSRSLSPYPDGQGIPINQLGMYQQAIVTTYQEQQGYNSANEQLKSCQIHEEPKNLTYDDYTFSDGYESYKKDGYSRESALTDLGYYDYSSSNSNDTLKQIVDKSINEQVSPPEPITINDVISEITSPITTNDDAETVNVSSATASLAEENLEEEVCNEMERLNLSSHEDRESHN